MHRVLSACLLAVVAAGPARADLQATFNSVAPSQNLSFSGYSPNSGQTFSFTNEPTGQLNFTVAGGTDAKSFGGAGAGLGTYCADLVQSVYYGSTYDYSVVGLAALPEMTGTAAQKATKAAELTELWGSHYAAAQTSQTDSAAFQLATWAIIYDTGTPNLTSGNFVVAASSQGTGAFTTAQSWLAALGSDPGSFARNYAGYQLVGLASPTAQDQIGLEKVPTASVPAPGGLLLGLIGVAGLVARRRVGV